MVFFNENPLVRLLAEQAMRRKALFGPLFNLGKRTISDIAGPFNTQGGNFGGSNLGSSSIFRNLNTSTEGFGPAGPQGGIDPLSLLFQQLLDQLQQQTAMPTGVDKDDLMAQVRGQIDPIYDQRSQEAQARGTKGRAEVKDMYRALANDYERLAPEQAEQAAGAQENIKKIYGELRSNIEGNYSRISDEQGDLFKQLGIESALPDVLAPQQEATNDATDIASELQAINEQRYLDQGNIDETYYREGSPLATMTGANTSKDMLFELNQYLDKLEGERSSGIQTAYTDLYGQAQQQLMQQQQLVQSENARKQQMLWEILTSQMQAQQPDKLDVNSFMGGLPPQLQQSVGSAFTSLQRSPEAVYGKTLDPRNPVPGTFVDTTPQWFMAQADQMLQRGEIDQATYQALLMYLQLNFGNK